MKALLCLVAILNASAAMTRADSLDDWLWRIRHNEAAVRFKAAYNPPVGDVSENTARRLIPAIKDPDPFVRRGVCSALGEFASHPALADVRGAIAKALVDKLEDPYPDVRNHATIALTKCGEPALALLSGAIRQLDVVVQRQGRLGIRIKDVTSNPVTEETSDGVLVSGVNPASPALIAGIRLHDRILSVGEISVQTTGDYEDVMRWLEPGTRVTLMIQRGDKTVTAVALAGVGPLVPLNPDLVPPDDDAGFTRNPARLADYAAIALAMLDVERVPVLNSLLESSSDLERGYAWYIASARKVHVELLPKLLRDDEWQERALQILNRFGEAGAKILPDVLANPSFSEWSYLLAMPAMGPAAVPTLAAELRSGSKERRYKAASILTEFGKDAVAASPELRKLLDDENLDVRVAAAAALASIGERDAAVVAALTRGLSEPDSEVFDAAVRGLSALGVEASPATPAVFAAIAGQNRDKYRLIRLLETLFTICDASSLAKALGHDNAAVRVATAETLGHRGTGARDYTARLMSVVRSDPVAAVRAAVVRSLGRVTGGREASEFLLAMLDDPAQEVRVACLAAMGDLRPVEPRVLEKLLFSLNSQELVLSAISSLNQLGAAARPGVPRLIELIHSQDPDVSAGAMRALGAIGPAAADSAPTLGDAIDHPSAVRSLARIGPAGLPFLREGLKRTDPWVRALIVEAIGELGRDGQPAAQDLVGLLHDPDPSVIEGVLESLRRVDPLSAETKLVFTRLLVDDRVLFRAAAARSAWEGHIGLGEDETLIASAFNDDVDAQEMIAQFDAVYALTGRGNTRDGAAQKDASYRAGNNLVSSGPSDLIRHECAALLREAVFFLHYEQSDGAAQSSGDAEWAPKLWPPPLGFAEWATIDIPGVFQEGDRLGGIFNTLNHDLCRRASKTMRSSQPRADSHW